MSEVSLAPEVIFNIGNIKFTNTFLATLAIDAILLTFVFAVKKNLKPIPGKLQVIAESAVDYFYTTTEQIAGKFADPIYPWFASFFIFIFVTNLVGLFPGFGSIGFFTVENGTKVFTPLLRAGTSDFNTTFALATISLVATHYLSIKYNGIGNYLKRFFSLNPVLLFVGILELISEITKVISLSFRLFGNIYAGEVVIHTINSIFAYIAPIPFLLLESIVAFVQALVFAMLTMVFMSILINPHEEGAH
ncbi:MAG TPA: F0F1 ATP synthase subunit A [Patescibacteria group bacterium]|nr:F0F1 ATP synthase subunit A [Patescibacteria group bacterium]